MGIHNVPEHERSAGMYCPLCKKGQPFSDRCAFCGCAFSCFVIMKNDTLPREKRLSNGIASSGTAKPVPFHRFLTPLCSPFIRFSRASLRVRVISLCAMLLLLTSLIVGIVQYRSSWQKNYIQNYVVAIYGINSGMNLTGMICDGKYKAWKEGVSLEISASGTVDSQTIEDLKSVKSYIDETREKMGAAPAELDQAARTLQKLYEIYEKMNSRIINSPDSLSLHKSESVEARKSFSREIENLKTNLPAPLAKEFKRAGQKYDLNFMGLK